LKSCRILMCVLLLSLVAVAANAATTIGVVLDDDGPMLAGVLELLRAELTSVLDASQAPEFPAELNLLVGDSPDAARVAIDRLLADRRVDLVLAVGFTASGTACAIPNPRKPLVATLILDTDLQEIPLTKTGTSGVPNLHYVNAPNLLTEDLGALYEVSGFSHVALLATETLLNGFPSVRAGDSLDLPDLAAKATWIAAPASAADLLAAVPGDADAVYLLPMPGLSEAGHQEVLDGLIARRLPCGSIRGETAVKAGALVGLTPDYWPQRLARRVALNIRRILSGRDASEIPVAFNREARLFLNRQTSRAIGVHPTFAVLTEAVLIDERRQDTGRLLDLQAVIAEAMARNLDLATEQRAVAAGREEVSIARSTLLPQVGIGAVGTMIDDDRAAVASTPAERTLTGTVDFSMVLWSDSARANHQIQKSLQEAREMELAQARLDVALDAAAAYFDVSRALTFEQIRKENLRYSRTNLENARVRNSLGQARPAEVYRWESKIALEKADVIDAAALRNQAEIELNRILDQPLEQPFTLEADELGQDLTVIMDPRVYRLTRDPWSLRQLREFLVEEGLQNSPELKQIDAALQAQERALTTTERSFWSPTVGLNGQLANQMAKSGVGSDLALPDGPDDTSWDLSLGVSLPLFEGGQRFAEKRQANEDLWRLRTERQRVANLVAQRIRSVTHRAGASTASVRLTKESATAAAENFKLVAESYSRGAVDIIALIDAQVTFLNSELIAADAVFANLLDLVELERAIGSFTFFTSDQEQEDWIGELEAFFVAAEEAENSAMR